MCLAGTMRKKKWISIHSLASLALFWCWIERTGRGEGLGVGGTSRNEHTNGEIFTHTQYQHYEKMCV